MTETLTELRTKSRDLRFSIANNQLKAVRNLRANKKEIAKILLPVIKKIPNKIEQAHWVQELGKRFQTDEKILMEEMKKTKDLSRGQSPINSGAAPSSFEKNGGSPRINSNRLEEYLFSLFWSQPELINDFKNQPSYLFVNPELANAFKKIKKLKTINQDALKENISVDLADRINFLVFKKEIEPTENFSPKKEIEFLNTGLLESKIKGKEIDKVVSNVPSHTKRRGEGLVKSIYSALFDRLNKILKENGKCVFLTYSKDLLKNIADEKGYRLIDEIEVKFKDRSQYILILEKI